MEEEARDLLALAGDEQTAESWISRGEHGEPLAWITGLEEIAGHPLRVDPGVYVPRPQSEELANRAAELLVAEGGPAADLCTGSGPIVAHLLATVPATHVVGVEIDRSAAECARRNGVPVVVGDLAEPLASSAFGVVTAVAPYVPADEFRTLPRDVQRYEPRRRSTVVETGCTSSPRGDRVPLGSCGQAAGCSSSSAANKTSCSPRRWGAPDSKPSGPGATRTVVSGVSFSSSR